MPSRIPKLLDVYRDHADAGLHGAAGWLLRRWQQKEKLAEIDKALASQAMASRERQRPEDVAGVREVPPVANVPGSPTWYVSPSGQTFTVIHGPVEFTMGSPESEPGREKGDSERQHRCKIPRSFAIATTHVTVEQFKKFNPKFDHNQMFRAPEPDCPILGVAWYEAAAYCNWLSEQEGIPKDQWCYVPNSKGEYDEGMKLADDYLHKTGYRLLTEAEWEYACRAGSGVSRYYGRSAALLDNYAWYYQISDERNWPVGLKKPNDFGLFDILGNEYDWTTDEYRSYGFWEAYRERWRLAAGATELSLGASSCGGGLGSLLPGLACMAGQEGKEPSAYDLIEDVEGVKSVNPRNTRVLRGGSFSNSAVYLRCANRFRAVPGNRTLNAGLRVARTLP